MNEENKALKIALIYMKYHFWQQPYITNWETNIRKVAGMDVKPFVNKAGNKNIPSLVYQNRSALIGRLLAAFFTSPRKVMKYASKFGPKSKLTLAKDIANLYPLISFSPNLLHLVDCRGLLKYTGFLKATKSKSIVTFRGGDILVSPWNNPSWKNYLTCVFENADRLHFVSKYLRDEAISLGAPLEKCTVIYPGVDTKFFCNNEIIYEGAGTRIKLLTTGRLVWEKGIEYALEAVKQLVLQGCLIDYTIVGDGEEIKKLKFLSHKFELESTVNFVGIQPQDVVKKHLADTQIYVQPSISESLCVAITEACAMGLPIVATRVGGIPEVVEDNFNGYLVRSQNPGELANSLAALIKNPSLRSQMGKNSKQIVEQKFTLDQEINNWVSLYNEIHFQ